MPKLRDSASPLLVVSGVVLAVPGIVCAGLFTLVSLALVVADRSAAPLILIALFVLPGAAVAAAGIGLVRLGSGIAGALPSADHEGEGS